MHLSPSKGKPLRLKPSLQKPLKDKGFGCEILSKTLSFLSKSSNLINIWWNLSKTLENKPINTLGNSSWRGERIREKRERDAKKIP